MQNVHRLTKRETEAAHRAAEGLTIKEIAKHMGITARTVGNTLSRVYDKLSIKGKHELGKVL